MRSIRKILTLALLQILVTQGAIATILDVPSPTYPTIQAGLNAAQSGDTVRIAGGTYTETVFWPFRNGITLIGAGKDNTIVNGNQIETVLYMAYPGIDSTTVVRDLGFRNGGDAGITLDTASPIVESCAIDSIRNGPGIYCLDSSQAKIGACRISDNMGSGVRCDASSPDIRENTIRGNTGSFGGGIYCNSFSSPTVTANVITGNSGGNGGGIYCSYSSPVVTENTITGNSAGWGGGGIGCSYSFPTLTRNTINGNFASSPGGGIYCSDSSPTLTENTIAGNSAFTGGGISCYYQSSPTMTGNMITGNSASTGGGISCISSSPTLIENAITGNSASYGGGIYCEESSFPASTRNTIASNSAFFFGGGIYCGSYCSPALTANTITGNSAGNGGGIYCIYSAPVLTENAICQNTATADGGAMYLDIGGDPQLMRNTVTENSAGELGDGIYSEGASPSVSSCNIAYNGWGFYNRSLTPIPNIQGNWWGDPTGPWHSGMNPGGLGDSLSLYTWDFIPYLAEADTTAPPIPPRNLHLVAGRSGVIALAWDAVPIGDLAGYRVYFDADSSGFPYSRSLDAGMLTEITLTDLSTDSTYYLAVTCRDLGGEESWYSREVSTVPTTIGVEEQANLPTIAQLEPTFPNPFRAETTVRYALPAKQRVRVTVYSTLGRHLATLVDGVASPGSHACRWQATDDQGRSVPPGVYLVRLETEGTEQIRKVVLID